MKSKLTLLITLTVTALAAVSIPAYLAAQTEDATPAPAKQGPRFVDADGDGICDLAGAGHQYGRQYQGTGKQGKGKGIQGTGSQEKGKGVLNGKGNTVRTRLQDGSCGLGGSGVCDGTGPKGLGKGRGGK